MQVGTMKRYSYLDCMSLIATYISVFVLQIVFSVGKVYDIKYSYDEKLIPVIIVSIVLSSTCMISTLMGIVGIMDGDWFMMFIYLLGGVVGKVIAFKVNKLIRK